MADVLPPQAFPSVVMSRLRGRGNKDTELHVARSSRDTTLRAGAGIYHSSANPSGAVPKIRIAIFVDDVSGTASRTLAPAGEQSESS